MEGGTLAPGKEGVALRSGGSGGREGRRLLYLAARELLRGPPGARTAGSCWREGPGEDWRERSVPPGSRTGPAGFVISEFLLPLQRQKVCSGGRARSRPCNPELLPSNIQRCPLSRVRSRQFLPRAPGAHPQGNPPREPHDPRALTPTHPYW